MRSVETFDAIVIGSGQAGKPLATDLAQAGWKIALIEREHVGGTCVNVGCTPTKTMVASARVAYLAPRCRLRRSRQRSQRRPGGSACAQARDRRPLSQLQHRQRVRRARQSAAFGAHHHRLSHAR